MAGIRGDIQRWRAAARAQMRHRGGPGQDTGEWMRAFSEIPRSPPEVEILRVDAMQP
jgi:hypothetical protein